MSPSLLTFVRTDRHGLQPIPLTKVDSGIRVPAPNTRLAPLRTNRCLLTGLNEVSVAPRLDCRARMRVWWPRR